MSLDHHEKEALEAAVNGGSGYCPIAMGSLLSKGLAQPGFMGFMATSKGVR